MAETPHVGGASVCTSAAPGAGFDHPLSRGEMHEPAQNTSSLTSHGSSVSLGNRGYPANIDYQAFAAISTDGGLSFQSNVQLTGGFSNPTTEGSTIGDYTGNTWDGPNYFLAAWMDNSNGSDLHDVVGGIRLK